MTTNFGALAALEGLIPEDVGRALYRFATKVPEGRAIIELGSFKGKSTCYLASGSADGFRQVVYAVDPWDLEGNVSGKHRFTEARDTFDRQVTFMGLDDFVNPIREFSTRFANLWHGSKVGLLFIDGDHSYENVRADFLAWNLHLAAEADILFDDYDTPRNPGVRLAIESLVTEGYLAPPVIMAGRLAWCTFP